MAQLGTDEGDCIAQKIDEGKSPLNATWDCVCRGKEDCEFPIIFGGGSDPNWSKNSPGINLQTPGEVTVGTENNYVNNFLYFERETMNHLSYSQ
jgi:hypothetical protein